MSDFKIVKLLDNLVCPLAYYQIDLTDLNSDPLYVGKTNSTGIWLIEQFSESAGTKLYANASNNSGYSDLDSAWADRTTLTFNQYHILTGV